MRLWAIERLIVCVGLALIAAGAVSGCIILPTPVHLGLGVITEEAVKSLKPGETSRAQVLLMFGAPADRYEEDRFFVYTFERIHGYLVLFCCLSYQGGGVGGGVAPMKKAHYLALEFTPPGRLRQQAFFEEPWFGKDRDKDVQQWMKEAHGSSKGLAP
jgi:outer membrane protein assembly factor BamE (lipoprotein component of BamABCDE complex)